MSPVRMSKIESTMRVVLEFNKAFNHHDIEGMVQLMSDDCVLESASPAPGGAVYSGKEAVTQFWQAFFRESPQAQIKIEDIFGLGTRCVMYWRYDWVDMAGEKGYARGVDIVEVQRGFICKIMSYIKG